MKTSTIKALYQAPLGTLVLLSDGHALTGLDFAKNQETATEEDAPIFAETRRWLDLYFSGKKPSFIPPLKPQGTPFQQKVWHELLKIPFGETTTYGEIARRVNCGSAQAIGQAVHRNPISIIIPCHRVIGADGSLTRYASGLDLKQRLLQLEKASL